MTRKKALERWETKIGNSGYVAHCKIRPKEGWIMVLQALNFIRPRKPTQLLTAWKLSSYP
jgi:hypothetical protein